MKRLFAILVILALVLMGCQKQTEQKTATAEQVSAPKAAVVQETPKQEEKNALFDKIDWNSIPDKSIILFVEKFGAEQYVNYGSARTLRLLIPIKNDFKEFVTKYDFKLETLKNNGKTVYALTELGRRQTLSKNGFDSLPSEVKAAYENLLDKYPNLLE